MTSRRDLIKAGAMVAMAGAVPSSVTLADPMPEQHKLAASARRPLAGARTAGRNIPPAEHREPERVGL